VLHLGLMAVVMALNGLAWDQNISFAEVGVGFFILVMAYAAAFVLIQTKVPWLIAAMACVVLADAIAFRGILEAGQVPERLAITSVEWFVSSSIAGIITMLVPLAGAPKQRDKKPYY
jgi:hypothetical protein